MKNILIILSLCLTIISCSNKHNEYETKYYVGNLEKEMKYMQDLSKEKRNIENDILNNVHDSLLRVKWDDVLLNDERSARLIISKIEEISYILMITVDSLEYFRYMDTTNPIYIRNYNEHEFTTGIINNGLNKVICHYLAWFDKRFENIKLKNIQKPVYENNFQILPIWNKEYHNIKTIADFQILKYKIYSLMNIVLIERFKSYKENVIRQNKQS